jgi:hypothetical protein
LIGLNGGLDRAQTFTAGLAGRLSVHLAVTRGANDVTQPLLVEIRKTSGGVPLESPSGPDDLGSVTIPAASIPVYSIQTTPPQPPLTPQALIDIDLSSQMIHVNAGEVLAITLSSDDPLNQAYQWDAVPSGSYSGGGAFIRLSGGWMIEGNGTRDFRFRTLVEIPEPTSLALIVVGFSLRTFCPREGAQSRVGVD